MNKERKNILYIMRRILFLICCFSYLPSFISAQEGEGALWFDLQKAASLQKERTFAVDLERGGGSLTLPFFDDFSRYSLPTNDPQIPASWQRWSDNQVKVNCTYPIAPLSLGVATFDAIGDDGRPYGVDSLVAYSPAAIENDLVWGSADTLTSLPIDLSGFTPEDNIYLLFHFESGGLGNKPDVAGAFEIDSLVMEFFSPFGAGEWFYAWSVHPDNNNSEFSRVFVQITDPAYFLNGFRFRFRNYASYGGAIDHWHLDYVLLSQVPNIDNFIYDEVSFQYCENTLLTRDYTSMPWTHFLSNPSEFMADNFSFRQRNLGITKNIASRTAVKHEDNQVFLSNDDLNTTGNAESSFTRTVSLNSYVYSSPDEVEEASFEVCSYFNPTDANAMNDTMCFVQNLENYYAYDDGSAESTYQTEGVGMNVAMKFTSEITDTLLGIMLSISPAYFNVSSNTFFVRAWQNSGGIPGAELNENFTFHEPTYYWDSSDGYVFYPLDNPTEVSGQFFVGWIQQSEARYYFGLDKNTAANGSKLFYKLDAFSPWQQSAVTGSVMIRPVFKAGLSEWVGVEETAETKPVFYPNPATDVLNLIIDADFEKYSIAIHDVAGKKVKNINWINNGTLNISIEELPVGYFTILMTKNSGEHFVNSHFIKQQ